MKRLTKEQHAAILRAYLGSINLKDLTAIKSAVDYCCYAGQNLGVNAQIKASEAFRNAVEAAANNLLQYDQNRISEVIDKVLNKD